MLITLGFGCGGFSLLTFGFITKRILTKFRSISKKDFIYIRLKRQRMFYSHKRDH